MRLRLKSTEEGGRAVASAAVVKGGNRGKGGNGGNGADGTQQSVESLDAEPAEFLRLSPPVVPPLLENVLLIFANSIPRDAREQCRIIRTGEAYDPNASDSARRAFLLDFVRERLEMVARREYALWLNGRLPFITPRELLLWRLRQFVEYIWGFQLPDNEDLALIFNTTKLRAASVASDFLARFRKALLFPIALRRLFRILRGNDQEYRMIDREYELKGAYGSTFLVPSNRYDLDANALIDEFRLREDTPLRDAEMINKTDNILWVHRRVLDMVRDDALRRELLLIYVVPREAGNEG